MWKSRPVRVQYINILHIIFIIIHSRRRRCCLRDVIHVLFFRGLGHNPSAAGIPIMLLHYLHIYNIRRLRAAPLQ